VIALASSEETAPSSNERDGYVLGEVVEVIFAVGSCQQSSTMSKIKVNTY
jgi:hypothetical protein